MIVAIRPELGRTQTQCSGDYRLHLGVGLAQSQAHRVPAYSVFPAQAGQGIASAAELALDPKGHIRVYSAQVI